jgi:hypothetical protein
MQQPIDSDRSYQIFKREADNTTVCVEVVKGIQEARKRVEEARATSPGNEHFIYDPLSEKAIDPVDPSTTVDPLTP